MPVETRLSAKQEERMRLYVHDDKRRWEETLADPKLQIGVRLCKKAKGHKRKERRRVAKIVAKTLPEPVDGVEAGYEDEPWITAVRR